MALIGKLEEIPFTEVLELLAMSEKTGRLSVSTGTQEALIVFRDGKIIYSASSTVRETFGSIVTSLGLISHEDLTKGLKAQHKSKEEKRLGSILVDMELLDPADLLKACQQQVFHVLKEILNWQEGFFRFLPLSIPDRGEAEVDPLNLLLERAVDARQVVFDVARDHDERSRITGIKKPFAEVQQPVRTKPDLATVGDLIGNVVAPSITAEMVGQILQFATEIVTRAVVFAVRGQSIHGVAQTGLEEGAEHPSQRVRAFRLPAHEDSILGMVNSSGHVYCGKLEKSRWNKEMIKRFGRGWPAEVIVIPIRVEGVVRMLVYGDNAPQLLPIGSYKDLASKLEKVERDASSPPSIEDT
jgi:hypothetical protein